MKSLFFVGVMVALVCRAVPAAADDTNEARAHYQRASAHFALGEFPDAAKEYESAYKLHPDPALLFDAAQAHRLAGHHQKALLLYRNYVQLYPTGASISSCRDQIGKLTAAISADEKAKSSPPTGMQEPSPQVSQAPPPPPAKTSEPPHVVPAEPIKPEPAPSPVVVTSPPERKPLYKKWWLWTAVGGAVVVAAVVTVAVVETRPGNSFSNVPDIGPRASMLVNLGFGGSR